MPKLKHLVLPWMLAVSAWAIQSLSGILFWIMLVARKWFGENKRFRGAVQEFEGELRKEQFDRYNNALTPYLTFYMLEGGKFYTSFWHMSLIGAEIDAVLSFEFVQQGQRTDASGFCYSEQTHCKVASSLSSAHCAQKITIHNVILSRRNIGVIGIEVIKNSNS